MFHLRKKETKKESQKSRLKALLPLAVIVLILLFAFLVRARAYSLPATAKDEKQYMQDENGEPYLTEMDSYYYLRKTAEMAEAGKAKLFDYRTDDLKIGQRIRVPHQSFMPEGLPSLAYLLWRYVFALFGVSLTQVAIWMGPVISALAAIPAFLYVKRRTNLVGGAVAGLLVGCAIPFVVHTHAGFFDTDMMLGILPLTFLLCQLWCMQEEKLSRQVILALVSALGMTGLYCIWGASRTYYLLALICAALSSLIVFLLPSKILPEKPWLRKWKVLRGALLSHVLSVGLLYLVGGSYAIDRLINVLGTIRFATGASSAAMPNAFQYTSEMMTIRNFTGWSPLQLYKAHSQSLLGMLGGAMPCLFAALMIPLTVVFLIFPRKRTGEEAAERKKSIVPTVAEVAFFAPWLGFSLKYAFTGVRYAEIAVLPIAVMSGLILGRITEVAKQGKEKTRKWFLAAGVILAILTVIPVCSGSWKSSGTAKSLVSDGRAQAMDYIREEYPNVESVAGWWDDGYYIQYRGEKRSLSDGGTSSGRVNWFLGKALMTNDPKLSAGIFRMLNETCLDALYGLMGDGMDETDAIALLLQILPMDREEAAKMLDAAGIDQKYLDMTHPLSSNDMALTLSSDLMGKILAMGYYGFWDPAKGEVTEKVAMFYSRRSFTFDAEGKAAVPMIGANAVTYLTMDPEGTLSAYYTDEQGNQHGVGRVCIWEDGVKIQDKKNVTYRMQPCVILVKEGERYCCALCTNNLTDSMLVRLFFCEDKSVENLTYLGTWYGNTEKEPCAAQRRIDYTHVPSYATQLWLYK